MRISHLSLKNVDPFKEAELDFRFGDKHAPITLITGENGTGKTTILDAIRGGYFYFKGIINEVAICNSHYLKRN